MNNIEKSKKLTELEVNTISLVSNKETPAVPKATTKFSVFKIFGQKKQGFSKEQIEKLNNIQKTYVDIAKIWDETDNNYRYRVKDPDLFDSESFKTIEFQKDPQIQAVIGKLKGETNTTTQSLLFAKTDWTEDQAMQWVEDHQDTL